MKSDVSQEDNLQKEKKIYMLYDSSNSLTLGKKTTKLMISWKHFNLHR